MRTCVRVERADDPACRRRFVLRVGRAAGRPQPPWPSRHRRGRRGACGQLRGEGVRYHHTDGRSPGAKAVPPGGRRSPADGCLQRGEHGAVRGVQRHDAVRRRAVDRRGVPRRRWVAADLRARRWRSPSGCGERSSRRSAFPSPWVSRGRSSSPRSPAEWRSPTVCCGCRPTVSWSSCTRFRSNGCGASGRSPRASSAPTPSRPWDRLRSSARRRSSGCSARPAAGISTPSPTTAIRGGSRSAAVAARWARSARSAEDRDHPTHSTRTSSRWSTDSRAGCERPTASAARSSFGCGSTTSRARRGRTRSGRRPRAPRRSSRSGGSCSPRRCR